MLLSEDPLSEGLHTWKGREEKGTGGLTYKMSSFVIVLRLWFRTGAEQKGSGFIIHSHGKIKVRNYIILLMTPTPNTEMERVVHKLSGNKIMFWSPESSRLVLKLNADKRAEKRQRQRQPLKH